MGGGQVDEKTPSKDELRDQQIKEENMKAFESSANKSAASNDDANHHEPFFGLFDPKVSIPEYLNEEERLEVEESFKNARDCLQAQRVDWEVERDKAILEKRKPDLSVKFVYGWTLLNSERVSDRTQGKGIMTELIAQRHHADECMYTLAHSCYTRGELVDARHHCETLLRMTPDSPRALNLHQLIRERQMKTKRDNTEAIAVAGAAVALGFVGVALLAIAGGGGRRS
jgi:hypothetical protein